MCLQLTAAMQVSRVEGGRAGSCLFLQLKYMKLEAESQAEKPQFIKGPEANLLAIKSKHHARVKKKESEIINAIINENKLGI